MARRTPTRTSTAKSSYERLAKLFGVAVVKVGAATQTELKEKTASRTRCRRTRAALKENIVPGGGIALLQAANAIRRDAFEDEDESTCAKIVLRALEEPLRQIAHNPVSRAR